MPLWGIAYSVVLPAHAAVAVLAMGISPLPKARTSESPFSANGPRCYKGLDVWIAAGPAC